MFDSLKRVFTEKGARREQLEAELKELGVALERRQVQLDQKRATRLESLFPEGKVEGAGGGHYPGLDPFNFEDGQTVSWLVTLATRIIDNLPGSETLLSQLDNTLKAFSDANHYRVTADGPHSHLLRWRDEALAAWDLDLEIPVYATVSGPNQVVGCGQPFLVLNVNGLALGSDQQVEEEQRFAVASCLGHVFFGNLKIFSFHRLMDTLDKLPSMSGLITSGLGMLPMVGNTISRGIEIARNVNNQVIRKTNLVAGMRQNLLCDRLATLVLGTQEPAQRYFSKAVLGYVGALEEPLLRPQLIEQGRGIHERFEAGEVDLHMMSVVGPGASFATFRAFKLDQWVQNQAYGRLRDGYYVTRSRLKEYRRTHKSLEEDIKILEGRLLELHERREKLQAELAATAVSAEAEGSAESTEGKS